MASASNPPVHARVGPVRSQILARPVATLIGGRRPDRRTLGQRFDPRHNPLTLMRLLLASIVAAVHASSIGWRDQPRIGSELVGDLAVDAFFVISGFLVTRSALRLPTLPRYVWHRFLRIMPGFWLSLLFTACVSAPLIAWLQGRSPASVFSGPESAWHFLLRNAALLMQQWDVADTSAGRGDEAALNGALWTLWYEALCYLAIAAAVVAGLLRRRGRPAPLLVRALRGHGLLAVTAGVWVWVTASRLGEFTVGPDILPRFLLLFLLGALGLVYAHRITFTPPLLAAAVATWLAGLFLFPDYRSVGGAGYAYLLLWAMVALPWRKEPPADLSYGIYVYHWPLQLVLAQAGLTAAGRPAFTVLTLLAAALLALLSWRYVEAPALSHKHAHWIDRLPRRLACFDRTPV